MEIHEPKAFFIKLYEEVPPRYIVVLRIDQNEKHPLKRGPP